MKFRASLLLLGLLLHLSTMATELMPASPLEGLEYPLPLLSGHYDRSMPTPEQILGFPVGAKTATPAQIAQAVTTWARDHERARLIEYARSHEDRPLYYVVISAPQNIARLDDIKKDIATLADPRQLSDAQAQAIIERLPAVAWMAYSIHGNESSGADAAIAAIYHLLASSDSEVVELLQRTVVIIDPSMNPDGRARFVKQLQQARGTAPNIDDQSLLHTGVWPFGRTNHYLFDLNRDFIFQVHPETRGRVQAINRWRPQLFIDGHEMGSQATYLFSPAREPVNKNLDRKLREWNAVFARDQAQAFDQRIWPYYTGEWFENLYAGYSSYSEFRGTIHILYEQARVAEDGVARPDGSILTYREAVHHQLTSTMANLRTLATHSQDIYRDYFADRRLVVSPKSPFAKTSYAILPTANQSRLEALVRLLLLQDVEVYTAAEDISGLESIDQLGQKGTRTTLPRGSVIIPNRQPEARLISAMLEFDTGIDEQVLLEERQNTLRDGGSIMYDVTAWNLSMMFGLEALTIASEITTGLRPYSTPSVASPELTEDSIAYLSDGADDNSVALAARLMERGVATRVTDKAVTLDGRSYSRGSIVVYRNDNRKTKALATTVHDVAQQLNLRIDGIGSGLGAGVLPDIGGRHFQLLERPSVALVSGRSINPYDYGAIWHGIDLHLGIRHTHLDERFLRAGDLRRYNVLIIPDRFGSLGQPEINRLKSWVEAGGTLIAIDGAITDLIKADNQFSSVRQLADTFGELPKYDLSLQREWQATLAALPDLRQVRGHTVPMQVSYPWSSEKMSATDEQLKAKDRWQALFMPSGALLAGRVDQQHWLSFGAASILPVLVSNQPILMSDDESQAVVRAGVYQPMSEQDWNKLVASDDDEKSGRRVGWSSLPDRQHLVMRMSGLLWPEASQRLANSAIVTREPKGSGQIILFAAQPNFRGATKGTNRLLLNAIVYGPGLGTRRVIEPGNVHR